MKRFLLFLALVFVYPAVARAQVYPQPPNVGLAANRPTFCSATGQQYYATDTTTLYYSTVAGTSCTWTAVGGGSASSAITALTQDVTAAGPGSVAATVVGANGALLPVNAASVATNSSGQLIAGTPSGGTLPGPYIAPQAVAGCGVEWTGLLHFTVGYPCQYIINGVTYATSGIQTLTLSAADPTNPRIDVIYIDSSGTAQILAGTPSGTPAIPTTDPSTQLVLEPGILVAANATTPSNISSVLIYLENTEWTTATGGTNSARVNVASTNNPYQGSVDVEFGNGGTVTTTTYVSYTDPGAGTVDLAASNYLVFYVRNKAAWAAKRSITAQFFNGATAKGTPIVISSGAYGFNSTTNTTTYQQIAIPTSAFGINGVPVTTLRLTVTGSGAALTGFYVDDASLQAGIAPPPIPTTLMNFRGTYSSAVTYNPNDVVISGGIGYVALVQNLNVATSTASTWTAVAGSPSGATTCNPGSYVAQTDGSTVTWAIGSNICANASLLFTAHSGSRTLNLTGMENGGDYILKLTQDGTGGEGLTLGSGCTWKVSGGGSGAVTLSTGVSAIDVLTWSYDGTNCLANLNKNFN